MKGPRTRSFLWTDLHVKVTKMMISNTNDIEFAKKQATIQLSSPFDAFVILGIGFSISV